MSTSTSNGHPHVGENNLTAQSSFWDNLFNSIFSPEYNTVPQKIMNFSFYGLFVVLAILVFLTDYNVHVIALFTLAIGLFISVNWYVLALIAAAMLRLTFASLHTGFSRNSQKCPPQVDKSNRCQRKHRLTQLHKLKRTSRKEIGQGYTPPR